MIVWCSDRPQVGGAERAREIMRKGAVRERGGSPRKVERKRGEHAREDTRRGGELERQRERRSGKQITPIPRVRSWNTDNGLAIR